METDFISRKDAKDKHCEICEHLNICYQYDGDDCHTYTGRTCIERQCFNTIPAADVWPVVRGKWEPGETIFFCGVEHTAPRICSVCGRSALDKPWYFCPNCGADMREVNNDQR